MQTLIILCVTMIGNFISICPLESSAVGMSPGNCQSTPCSPPSYLYIFFHLTDGNAVKGEDPETSSFPFSWTLSYLPVNGGK